MKNKLFAMVLTASLVTPAIVAPLNTDAAVQKSFKDVSEKHWAYDTILEMQKKNVINGYPDGTFKPSQEISRKHVAALLSRVLPLAPLNEQVNFVDVPKTHPYYDEISKVQRAGLFGGSKGKFNPDAPLTRIQMSQILYRAFQLKVKYEHNFPDIKKGTFESEQVSALFSNGITTGSEGLYKPYEPVSRAHYATFLQRALNVSKDVKPTEPTEPTNPTVPQPEEDKTPSEMKTVLEQLSVLQKKNDGLFIDKTSFNGLDLSNNPMATKMYLEGMDAVRTAGLKFYTGMEEYGEELNKYNSFIKLTSDGYKNPTERLGNTELLFIGTGEREGTFNYDYRSDKAQNVAKEWVKIGFPEISSELIPIMEQKVAEGRVKQNSDEWWGGNGEGMVIGDYQIRLGVDSFLENMAIEIEYKK